MLRKPQVDGDELERIGGVGEDFFSGLCKKAGLKCSKLYPDRTGRDFIVTFPLGNEGPLSFDKRPGAREAVVQVKTILETTSAASVSLSVAEMLAKEHKPAIICILRLNESYEVVAGYFVHLLDDVLARVLKRLRQASKNGRVKLNKESLSFKATPKNEIGLGVADFFGALGGIIGPSMEAYTVKKVAQLSSLGFDNARHTMSFNVDEIDNIDLIDGFLGLKPLPVSRMRISELRFNIDLPISTAKSGILTIEHDYSEKAVLKVSNAFTNENIELPCEYIVNPMATSPADFGAAFRSEFGLFILRPNKWKFEQSENFDSHRTQPISRWVTFFKLATILNSLQVRIEIRSESVNDPLTFHGENEASKTDDSYQAYLKTITFFRDVWNDAGVPNLPVTADLALNSSKLSNTLKALTNNRTARFSAASSTFPGVMDNKQTAYVTVITVLGVQLGLFMPMVVTATEIGGETLLKGFQTGTIELQYLGEDHLAGFERFCNRMLKISQLDFLFSQQVDGECNPTDGILVESNRTNGA